MRQHIITAWRRLHFMLKSKCMTRQFLSIYLQLPQFDNMYLDMNGIIHVCSHPDDSNVHFRMSEEQMFRDILHYIDTIFHMIKPRKLFFMAVDGVAPRAKMNQQRSRRYLHSLI